MLNTGSGVDSFARSLLRDLSSKIDALAAYILSLPIDVGGQDLTHLKPVFDAREKVEKLFNKQRGAGN